MLKISILIFLITLTACQENKKGTAPLRLKLNLQEGDPPSFNPYVGVDLRSRCLYLSLFEPLMRKNGNGELECAAAERFEIDPTKTIYTFHIRPHQWSNGEPVTSHHFANAWVYALTPNTHCVRADLFYPIKNAEKVKKGQLPIKELKVFTPDEKTLIVELEHPTAYFLDLTATSFFSPLYEATNSEPTLFNGPFVLGKQVHNQKLILNKNRSYWDADSVELEEIYFTTVKDPMTAYIMYENGELDLVGDPFSSLPLDLIPTLEKTGKLKNKVISRIFYLLINTTTPPFNNVSFRKALSLSIDRDQVVKHLFFGELPTYSSLPSPLSMTTEDEFKQEEPASLFEKALVELKLTREEFPKIVFSYAELSGQKRLAEFLQNQWKEKLGIQVEVSGLQWNTHIANLRNRNYQIGTLHLTTLYQDPMFYFDCFKDQSSLCNYTGWEHPEFRKRIELAELLCDTGKRRSMLKEAELQLFDEMPAIPLFTQNLQYLSRNDLDLVILDLGIYDFKQTKIRRRR